MTPLQPASILGTPSLRSAARAALALADPAAKVTAVQALHEAVRQRGLVPDPTTRTLDLLPMGPMPGRPERPRLVPPQRVPQRSPNTPQGRAALLHAIAHIEFNAINLALDAVWRFEAMPPAYYLDWMQVAAEEALHFTLLAQHLATLGHGYGDFDAHDGLWQLCEATAGDGLARMALVPRTMEARGLDATPAIRAKLAAAGDATAVDILDRILRDEVGHVAIGNHWFRWLCDQAGRTPEEAYATLARLHRAPRPRPPLNRDARLAAGFTEAELDALESPPP